MKLDGLEVMCMAYLLFRPIFLYTFLVLLPFLPLLASTVPSVLSFSSLLSHYVSSDTFVSLDSELGPGGRVSRTNRNEGFPLCETKNSTQAMWRSQRNPQGVCGSLRVNRRVGETREIQNSSCRGDSFRLAISARVSVSRHFSAGASKNGDFQAFWRREKVRVWAGSEFKTCFPVAFHPS